MAASMEADALDSSMGFEDESFESDLGENTIEFSDDGIGDFSMDGIIGKDGEMIESYDKREMIIQDGDVEEEDLEPYEGMEFDSEDAARAFYNAYASRAGFRVRVSRFHRSVRDGAIICRHFVCSREGFSMHKNQAVSKRQRAITRVGCMAMLAVKKNDPGKWFVSKFVKEHNHEPMAPRKVDLKPCVAMRVNKVENGIDEEISVDKLVSATFCRGNSDFEPCDGMEFRSEEEARTFYYSYAKEMGFTVRISKCRRDRDGSVIFRRFVCSREGYYVRKYGRTKRSRALTRVGCLARLVVKKLDSGIWVVANFEKEHNHPPFVIGEELSYQPTKPTRHDKRNSLDSSQPLSNLTEVKSQNGENSMIWRYNKLHREGIRFAEEGATSVEVFNVAMSALQEATQKVVAARNNAIIAPKLDNLVSSSNRGDNLTDDNWVNNGVNQLPTCNQDFSNDGRHAGFPSEVIHQQKLVDHLLISSGLPNSVAQSSLAINLPNGQAFHGGPENAHMNFAVSVPVQKRQSPDAQSLNGNGSLSSGVSAVRKHKYNTVEENVQNFITFHDFSKGESKQDGTATPPQQRNVVEMDQPGSNNGSCGNSSNMALSGEQVVARQAVSVPFNVLTMGNTSSSGLVHATAIAAGARIAPPEVAASLFKAVQSRSVVHIRPGEPSTLARVAPPVKIGAEGADSREHHEISNMAHYFRAGNGGALISPQMSQTDISNPRLGQEDQTSLMMMLMDDDDDGSRTLDDRYRVNNI